MSIVNEIELQYIKKIFDDNILLLKTNVHMSHLTDPFAKTMYFEFNKAIRDYGEIIPSKHLSELVNDEIRMEKFGELNYPLEINKVADILNYINSFETNKKISTLEKTILDSHTKRVMIEISEMMQEDLYDSKKSIKDVIRKYSFEIENIKYGTEDDITFLSAEDIISEERKRLQSDEVISYTRTGFNFIDDIAGGITAPSTIYVVAPAGVGKSIWLYDSTVRALRQGESVLFATVEIPAQEAYLKILANFTGINYHTILKKSFTNEEKIKYKKGLEEFNKYKDNLYMVYNRGGLSPMDIKHYYKNLEKCGIKCKYIAIDYLGLLNSDNPKHTEVEKYTNLPKQIRVLSQETNSIILIPHQLKSSQAMKDIEDLNADSVWYAKSISHESTLAFFMMRKQDEGDITLMKDFKSRIGMSKGTYVFRYADRNKCMLGEDELYNGSIW